jgi:Protein of unknown function (DUF2695)
VDDDFEQWRDTAVAMSTHPRECVLCYVHRMVTAFGCDGTLRWLVRWRDRRAPRAMALPDRLTAGGARCDCELITDDWAAMRAPDDPGAREPEPCAGSPGAALPCDNWAPRRFGR